MGSTIAWPAPSPAFAREIAERQIPLAFDAINPVLAEEAARRIGVSVDTFYRRWRSYVALNGMPNAILPGKVAFPRAEFLAWINRRREQAAHTAANENNPMPDSMSDLEQRAELARIYGGYR